MSTKQGRPARGAYINVSVSISTNVMRRVNEMAAAAGLSRSETIETLLRVAICEAGKDWPQNVITKSNNYGS